MDFHIYLQTPVLAAAEQFLFREGDATDALCIVSRGALRIMSGNAVYGVAEAGGIVGAMTIVEKDKPRRASAIFSTSLN